MRGIDFPTFTYCQAAGSGFTKHLLMEVDVAQELKQTIELTEIFKVSRGSIRKSGVTLRSEMHEHIHAPQS